MHALDLWFRFVCTKFGHFSIVELYFYTGNVAQPDGLVVITNHDETVQNDIYEPMQGSNLDTAPEKPNNVCMKAEGKHFYDDDHVYGMSLQL